MMRRIRRSALTPQRAAWAAGGLLIAYLVARAYRHWATGRHRTMSAQDADDALDEMLSDSFPASDPPSWTSSGAIT